MARGLFSLCWFGDWGLRLVRVDVGLLIYSYGGVNRVCNGIIGALCLVFCGRCEFIPVEDVMGSPSIR